MISASFDPVSAAMWRTAVLIVAMSPLPVLPRVTPQSTSMCCGPRLRRDGDQEEIAEADAVHVGMRQRSVTSCRVAFFAGAAISDSSVCEREVDLKRAGSSPADEPKPDNGRAAARTLGAGAARAGAWR